MTYVEDHDVVSLHSIVDAVRVSGGRQDTDLRVRGHDANERVGQKAIDSVAQMLPDAIGCGR